MSAILAFLLQHPTPILFGAVFADQLGLPVPALAVLIAGGAATTCGKELGFPLV